MDDLQKLNEIFEKIDKENFKKNSKEFFWANVEKTNTCWNWVGSKSSKKGEGGGYGQFWVDGKMVRVHRFSYELHKGKITNGLFVCHTCDNSLCVNPDHLWLGTNKENITDMMRKQRGHVKPGEENPQAKLTWEKVRQIRELYVKNEMGYKKLGRLFSVNWRTIADILKNVTWLDI